MLQHPGYFPHDGIEFSPFISLPLKHPRQIPPEEVPLIFVLTPRHHRERDNLVRTRSDGDELGGEDVFRNDELGDGGEVQEGRWVVEMRGGRRRKA